MTKHMRKLTTGDWLLRWTPGFKVPCKLKKAWRKLVLQHMQEAYPDYRHGRHFTLHWKKGTGWTVTTRG